MKTYFDRCRTSNILPHELQEHFNGSLVADLSLITRFRDWRRMKWQSDDRNVSLCGALDDCGNTEDGRYAPIDFKTKGTAPTENSWRYYVDQLDCYALLLEKNGFRSSDRGYILFLFPCEPEDGGIFKFSHKVYEVATSPERAEKLFWEAVQVVNGELPRPGANCSYCRWIEQSHSYLITDRDAESQQSPIINTAA